jgi:Protein of unknown function with HXXEE motif
MKWRLHHIFLALILVQAAHSVEEYVFRLYDVLRPASYVSELFGVDRASGFAVANSALVLFGLWCWYARVRRGRGRELAWLWALVEIANGCGHIALAVWAGGYFPGLATAPPLLGLGAWLALRLRAR